MKAYLEAYGCTLNMGESREVKDLLVDRGWQIVGSPADADLAVISTCVVVEKTEREMLKRVQALRDRPRLIITGCMATACREKAMALAPKAEFVSPADMTAMARAIGDDGFSKGERIVPPEDLYHIIPIATGCLGDCSYCITRLARGQLKSRNIESIVDHVRMLASRGPSEMQLAAQDTAAYGADSGSSLPELVERVCAVPGDFRVRVGMMNPRSALGILERLERIYRQPKVFKFLHLPIQSGSNAVLSRMVRGYSVEDFEIIVSTVRAVAPEITVSTDIIVGYPGETERDHRLNMELIARARPDIVNVTRFSPRPGTAAANERDHLVGWRAKKRSRELSLLRFSIALDRNNVFVGRTVRALSTEIGKNGSTILRTDEYKQVVVESVLDHGRWYRVKIDRATPTYLVGHPEGLA